MYFVLKLHFVLFLATFPALLPGQINGYAKVTAISGNVLSISNANQVYDSLKSGDRLILIQMQGATITNSSNTSSFGDLNSTNSAGLYEIVFISLVNSAATSITLTSAPTNTYDPAGSVQVVTYPLMANGYTVASTISALPWNGSIGGIIALSTTGNLTLQNNITADFAGFRGGLKAGQNSGNCEDATWIASAGGSKYAAKGEGVYQTKSNEAAGKAMAVNGGGGGSVHNGGGGGGGNKTAGGTGYYGYTAAGYCSSTLSAAGQGGRHVPSNINRVFFGGGGGGGHENNSVGSSGGNGGGIIFLKTDTIIVEGSCFPFIISANGQAASSTGNDGAGGGGAGGTIVLEIKGTRVNNACPLEITADGGNGGDVNNSASHGAGGGGGQGAIYVSASGTFSNVVFRTDAGDGGEANNSGNPRAGDGGGSANTGVSLGAGNSVLPILELTAVKLDEKTVELGWQYGVNTSAEYFEMETSGDGINWTKLPLELSRAENSATRFRHVHRNPAIGANLYRVTVTAPEVKYSNIALVQITEPPVFALFPNPADNELNVPLDKVIIQNCLIVRDVLGHIYELSYYRKSGDLGMVDISKLPEGIYFTEIRGKSHRFVIVRR